MEEASRKKEQARDIAGGYAGLVIEFFKYPPLSQYYMVEGDEDGYWKSEGGIYLLGCECGEVGCWPLIARVTSTANTVTWDGFKQPHRAERDYSKFGPFIFDAEQYQSAIADAERAISREKQA